MRWPKPLLQKIVFELRYAQGHRYLDRCGETFIEIEDRAPGWVPQEVTPSNGALIHLEKEILFNFNSYKLDAVQEDPKDTKEFRDQVALLADIVCRNLGISSFIRIGVRFIFLYPATSMEEAEEMVRRSQVATPNPRLVEKCGHSLQAQKHIFIFQEGNAGRRIEIGALRREEGRLAPQLLAVEPRNLPKGQREALIRKLQETRRYSEDPRFSLQVDIDNYEYDPDAFSVPSFVEKHEEFARNQLLELLRSGQ
jgi:hypothetical protein